MVSLISWRLCHSLAHFAALHKSNSTSQENETSFMIISLSAWLPAQSVNTVCTPTMWEDTNGSLIQWRLCHCLAYFAALHKSYRTSQENELSQFGSQLNLSTQFAHQPCGKIPMEAWHHHLVLTIPMYFLCSLSFTSYLNRTASYLATASLSQQLLDCPLWSKFSSLLCWTSYAGPVWLP